MCIIKIDGTGFHQLSDGTFTDFNPTWTRDGTNTPVWNRKHPDGGRYSIMASAIGASPGREVALTDPSSHAWVHSSLRDGRLLVAATPPQQRPGYDLMTPRVGGTPTFEPISCELGVTGILDRISVSPSETTIFFESNRASSMSFLVARCMWLIVTPTNGPSRTSLPSQMPRERRCGTPIPALRKVRSRSCFTLAGNSFSTRWPTVRRDRSPRTTRPLIATRTGGNSELANGRTRDESPFNAIGDGGRVYRSPCGGLRGVGHHKNSMQRTAWRWCV